MKKTNFLFVALTVLLIMGCTKDELIDDANSDLQLKKGSPSSNSEITSFSFYGKPVYNYVFFALKELKDESKILKNGTISGSFGAGKRNAFLGNYNFTDISTVQNNPGQDKCWTGLNPAYSLVGAGTVYINSVDYFEFEITDGLYEAGNLAAGCFTPDFYMGGIIICNNAGQGKAKITKAYGKFKAFAGKPLEVYRDGGMLGIERLSGKLNLAFHCRLNPY